MTQHVFFFLLVVVLFPPSQLGYDQAKSTMCPLEGLNILVSSMKSQLGMKTRTRKRLTTGRVQNERFHNTQHHNS